LSTAVAVKELLKFAHPYKGILCRELKWKLRETEIMQINM
jgi:hypothetical protein